MNNTKKPDFTFEAGKTYYTYDKKLTVTITKRSACYVSVVDENGETLRRKILTYTDTISTGDGRVCEAIYLHEHVNVSARDEIQPEKPQTSSIPDTTNITPADDNSGNTQTVQENTQTAQHETVKFVVGKTYYETRSNLILNGKHRFLVCAYTVIKRTSATVTISETSINEYCATVQKTSRRKIRVIDGVEHITPNGSYYPGHPILPANAPTVKPNFLLTDSAQPESSQPDTVSASMPAAVTSTESDNTTQPAEAANTESELGKWLALQDHWKKLAWLANGGLGTLSYLNATPEAVTESIAKGISAQEYEITKQFCNCEYSPSKFRAMLNCFTMSGINKYLDMLIHFHRPQNFSKNQAIEFLVTTYIPLWEKEQAKRKAFTAHLASTQSETTAQPEALYDDDSYSDFSGDNSSTDMDIPEEHEPDIIPETHDNPGFTVIPHDRMHIEHPEYTVYPDTITDECPYTVIPACDIPTHNPAAAVVPYADARNIRNFFHILAIYIRMWLAINIHKLNIAIPMPSVFPPVIIPATVKDITPQTVKFEVGKSYSASLLGSSRKSVVTVTAKTYKPKDKGVIGHIVLHEEGSTTTFGMELRANARGEYVKCNAYSVYCNSWDEIVTAHSNNHDTDPEIIPAKVKDITPQPTPQKLDRLWLFADDMKDYNMIRRKNKSLIDACDSEEAITALMLTLDTTDILNQANYCRVHLCTGIPHSSDHKSDEQLAREFAAVIMKRRAKKLKASLPKTQQKPEKKEPAPASAPELNGKLIDTANLHGNDWRNAHRHNISVISSCLFQEAVTALLQKVSVSTIREIGGQLGTLNRHVKGNKSQLIARFVDRLFEIRSIRNK